MNPSLTLSSKMSRNMCKLRHKLHNAKNWVALRFTWLVLVLKEKYNGFFQRWNFNFPCNHMYFVYLKYNNNFKVFLGKYIKAKSLSFPHPISQQEEGKIFVSVNHRAYWENKNISKFYLFHSDILKMYSRNFSLYVLICLDFLMFWL